MTYEMMRCKMNTEIERLMRNGMYGESQLLGTASSLDVDCTSSSRAQCKQDSFRNKETGNCGKTVNTLRYLMP